MKRDTRAWRAVDAAYGWALRLYPRAFRERWAEPMRQAFRDRCREVARGERSGFSLLHESLADLAAGAGRERIRAMEGIPVSRFHWMLALLAVFAAMLAMHDRMGTAGLAAIDWWKQRQVAQDEAAIAGFYRDAAAGLERAGASTRSRTIAAVLRARAGGADTSRAWPEATSAQDPLALWLAAVDCPVSACDEHAALASLVRLEPDNAAVGQIEMGLAARAGDAFGMRNGLRRMAMATRYDSHETELVQGLLRATDGIEVPRRLLRYGRGPTGRTAARTALAADIWTRMATPSFTAFLDACRPGVSEEDARDCVAAARTLSNGDTLMSRSIGPRVWYRLAGSTVERDRALVRWRDWRWLGSNVMGAFDTDTARGLVRWREARMDTGSEVAAFRALERARGIPDTPPAGFQPDPAPLAKR
jgi:hypothetical protein